jgi:fatty aldehyde-generating acyl-ACP reductase
MVSAADFALIGHLESWSTAVAVLSALRGRQPSIPLRDLEEILPWLPPRTVCRITIGSSNGSEARGVYVDAFIPPDRLEACFLRENLNRVREAAEYAIREGARIVTLGGFSSILLEGKLDLVPQHPATAFTTGNTLTVALIIRGMERAVELTGRSLQDASLLIIGASGDVGSGCARCFAPRVKRLLLCARNGARVQKFATELIGHGAEIEVGTHVQQLAAKADFIICAASLAAPTLFPEGLAGVPILCDAGYPKNLHPACRTAQSAVFFGGLGQVRGGISYDPDLGEILNPHPFPNVAHGCLLEGMALALEGRFEPFSRGRGLITPSRVEEIWNIAQKHGIVLAPLFNAEGPAEDRISSLSAAVRP